MEQETHQQRRGPAVESLQDHELFFVDKVSLARGVNSAAPLPCALRCFLCGSDAQHAWAVTCVHMGGVKQTPRKRHIHGGGNGVQQWGGIEKPSRQ